ncbi:hypothetical protein [Tepidibacter mesophilus]|uniref:hypothetical protein n=1 Tax=Tepidibacter mesophilus TaxID=655607 RepID=UPI000C0845E1|nr:hypothetical protein [Tepidibacter mesophilus]
MIIICDKTSNQIIEKHNCDIDISNFTLSENQNIFKIENLELLEKVNTNNLIKAITANNEIIDIEEIKEELKIIENPVIDEEKIMLAETIVSFDERLRKLEGGI